MGVNSDQFIHVKIFRNSHRFSCLQRERVRVCVSDDPIPCRDVTGQFLWPLLYAQTNSCKQMKHMTWQTASKSHSYTAEARQLFLCCRKPKIHLEREGIYILSAVYTLKTTKGTVREKKCEKTGWNTGYTVQRGRAYCLLHNGLFLLCEHLLHFNYKDLTPLYLSLARELENALSRLLLQGFIIIPRERKKTPKNSVSVLPLLW